MKLCNLFKVARSLNFKCTAHVIITHDTYIYTCETVAIRFCEYHTFHLSCQVCDVSKKLWKYPIDYLRGTSNMRTVDINSFCCVC